MLMLFSILHVTTVDALSVELDMLHLNKCLQTLDDKISTFFTDPDCTKRDEFLTWFHEYNKHFSDLVSLLGDGEVRAERIATPLILRGGPGFLKRTIDTDLLKTRLFWGDYDVQEMFYYIGATKVLWFEMKNVLSPFGERHLRNLNIPQELYELDKRGRLKDDVHFSRVVDSRHPADNETWPAQDQI